MKSVGIKALKNNLSRYLDLVRQGEVVLITDRDEVIAELRLPTEPTITRASAWAAFLEGEARRGKLRLPKRRQTRLEPTERMTAADVQAELARAREDR
jgi:antitoxin (DNA-binding transcriptional repressor) of toxin-antitoxin stability system